MIVEQGYDPLVAWTIRDAVWLSFKTRRGDWSFRPDFGSEFHLLARVRATADVADRAAGMARSALKWLVDLGHLRNLSVSATLSGTRLTLSVRGETAQGDLALEYPVPFAPVGAPEVF